MKIIQTLFFAVLALGVFAQQDGISIGITAPHESAVLHIQSSGQPKGLLIPRFSTDDRNNIANPANGLLVYDSILNELFSFRRRVINQNAPNYPATWQSVFPRGGIIMWSGNTIPDGWALCDGENGTPDLKGRFIVAGGLNENPQFGDTNPNYSVGNTGGRNSVILTNAQVPTHTHAVTGGAHSHTGTTNNTGNHHHNWSFPSSDRDGGGGGGIPSNYSNAHPNYRTSSNGNHSHAVNINNNGPHSHTVSSSGGGNAHENRPPYYVLAFIMKL